MLPVPTRAALTLFLASTGVLMLGIATSTPETVTLACSCFLLLTVSLAATVPLSRRARRERLEFAWWIALAEGRRTTVVGSPFVVRCFARNHARTQRVLLEPTPIVGPDVRLAAPSSCAEIPARSRAEFNLELVAITAGRKVIQGLAVRLRGPLGLFEAPLYFPNTLALQVLPRPVRPGHRIALVTRGSPVERKSPRSLQRRGVGTELYELREFQAGDPFKSIAWKASARLGSLMVREVEREVQHVRWLVLDVSGTMRGGPLGSRPIDVAVEWVAAETARGLEADDRVGFLAVDERIVAHVPARDGRAHGLRVLEALLDSVDGFDADRTEVGESELAEIVGRYCRMQHGADFRGPSEIRQRALARHVLDVMIREESKAGRATAENTEAILRDFCRLRGISLPYRTEPVRKAWALASAVLRATARPRQPADVVIFSDLDRVTPLEPFIAALLRAHRHGHRCVVVVPRHASPSEASLRALERELGAVFQRARERHVTECRERLGRIGVPVFEDASSARSPERAA